MSDERETSEAGAEKLVIHDKRRIDPQTGAVRPGATPPPAPAAPGGSGPITGGFMGLDPAAFAVPPGYPGGPPEAGDAGEAAVAPDEVQSAADQIAVLQMEVAERTSDLQRVLAEYQNYRRRVDRDRDAARDLAIGGVILELLPVLDDIGRAQEHGELVGGFKSVADALGGVLTKLGVMMFGEAGEPFDPSRHEALMHTYSDEVSETTAIQVFQPGYRLRDRVLRPARVAVADPTEALPAPDVDAPASTD